MKCGSEAAYRHYARSLPVRGAWVEIPTQNRQNTRKRSLPVRGAWVEIEQYAPFPVPQKSLPVRGAWVEMLEEVTMEVPLLRRSPCGERGLK